MKVQTRSAGGWRQCCFTLCVCFCVLLSLNQNENPLSTASSVREKCYEKYRCVPKSPRRRREKKANTSRKCTGQGANVAAVWGRVA